MSNSFNSLLSTSILFFAITTGKLQLLQRTETSRSSTFSVTENHALMGCGIHKQRSYNFFSCAHLCLARSGCASVNYENIRNGMCELNRLPSPTSVTNKARPGYLFGQLVVSIFLLFIFLLSEFWPRGTISMHRSLRPNPGKASPEDPRRWGKNGSC